MSEDLKVLFCDGSVQIRKQLPEFLAGLEISAFNFFRKQLTEESTGRIPDKLRG